MNVETLTIKFIKFGIVGFSGVLIDFGITFITKEKLKIQKYISNSLGFTSAATSNYFLNRIWTFRSEAPEILIQYAKFIAISLIGLLINNLVIWIVHDKGKINFYLAKLFAIAVVIIWNFSMNYLYTFKQ